MPSALFDLAATPRCRALGWVAAGVLTLYGGLLTVVGLAVQSGLLTAAPDADHRAVAWHTFVWDPWFLLWGLALGATLWSTAPGREVPADRSEKFSTDLSIRGHAARHGGADDGRRP